jgi:DnaA family protein
LDSRGARSAFGPALRGHLGLPGVRAPASPGPAKPRGGVLSALHPQQSFRFAPSEHARFDNFEAGANTELLQRLQAPLAEPRAFDGIWLFGPAGRGKSHLLQATAQAAAAQDSSAAQDEPAASLQVAYLPLARIASPLALEGLEAMDLVLLDDIDRWLGSEDHERALMALYTGLFQSGARLVVASVAAPAALVTVLPDLASRLRALASFELQDIDDDARARVLVARAQQRGLPLAPEPLRYWLRRGPRDLKRLLEDLELLLDDALGEQSPVTVNSVKRVLQL